MESEINPAELRTLFDNLSNEWSETTLEKKVKILRNLLNDYPLLRLVLEVKGYYGEKGYKDIDMSIIFSIVDILEFLLKNPEQKQH